MKLKPLRSCTLIRDLDWVKANVKFVKGCWLWSKSTSDGYGQFVHIDPKTKAAKSYRLHRYVYQICVSVVPDDMLVRHSCANRLCCNPEHLSVGTHLDNYHDSYRTHARSIRIRTSKKLRAVNATLCDRTAASYRRMFSDGRVSIQDIIDASGLSYPTVLSLLRGKTYRRLGMQYVPLCIERIENIT